LTAKTAQNDEVKVSVETESFWARRDVHLAAGINWSKAHSKAADNILSNHSGETKNT